MVHRLMRHCLAYCQTMLKMQEAKDERMEVDVHLASTLKKREKQASEAREKVCATTLHVLQSTPFTLRKNDQHSVSNHMAQSWRQIWTLGVVWGVEDDTLLDPKLRLHIILQN